MQQLKIKNAAILIATATALLLFSVATKAQKKSPIDELTFASITSERTHRLKAQFSQTIKGGQGQQARILLPKDTGSWEGGTLAFTMKVDPLKQNYFTAKFWGSDRDKSMLMLFCKGKQVGYRHLGDIDLLWLGNGQAPRLDCFFYVTLPLPMQHTKGKRVVNLEIRSYGDIWGYGETFDKYQRKLEQPTLGIYKAYTHTVPAFVPGTKEMKGKSNAVPVKRTAPGIEVMAALKQRVHKELNAILAVNRPLNQQEIMFLAPAFSVKWTTAYNQPEAVSKIIYSIDAYYKVFLIKPDTIWKDRNVYNSDWLVTGPIARGIRQLWKEISPVIDETFDNGKGGLISRRKAWSELLQAHLKYSTTHRRQYTNQSMIIDLFLYDANRALMLLDPQNALPEYQTLRYLYESVGLAPWLGKETAGGPEKPLGDHYYQLTAKGLTKELGFVGYYGEVLDWVVDIYRSTCVDGIPGTGDAKIKQQLLKMMQARSYFRYPALDEEGYKAMRAEAVIGWRDGGHYPGDILYGDRGIAWDATPLMTAAATLDPQAIGMAQQMLDDNQFVNILKEKLKLGGIRVTKGLLHIPDEYETIKSQKAYSHRLPMTEGAPDFVFSDEEDGVVAIKNGQEILYTSLYWRARNAVNNLAKVHYITPTSDRIANIYIETQFDSSGLTFTRPNWVNLGWLPIRNFYPGIESAHTGEVLQIAKVPEGIRFTPGDENVYAGKANFYKMEYGNYLVAMNTTKDRAYELAIPPGFANGFNLTEKAANHGAKIIKVGPRSTVVLVKEVPRSFEKPSTDQQDNLTAINK